MVRTIAGAYCFPSLLFNQVGLGWAGDIKKKILSMHLPLEENADY